MCHITQLIWVFSGSLTLTSCRITYISKNQILFILHFYKLTSNIIQTHKFARLILISNDVFWLFLRPCACPFSALKTTTTTHTHRANNYLRCIQLNLWTSKLLDLMWSLLHWLTGACYDYKWMWMPKRPKRPKRHFNISPGWSNIYLAWTWVFSSHRYI